MDEEQITKTYALAYQGNRPIYDRGGFFSVIGTPSQWADIVNHLRRLAGYTPEEVGLNARLYLQKRADTDGNWRKII